ncbi:hypothetical protein DMH02_027020 [Streptomyces sp. WAC 00631]|uniref:hypothetical protein n=1 Tax=unclassified Streptomyces TaxID=2593676 RepID=UPI000F769A02|nr:MULTISPECIES: hypothetical protein [unclassified Streptomyces]MCC5036725.1 hypothetical protein [Streptomyces sp. WAC 00631]MCC9738136.1 hypothetical protein [Streptomyces sp. MNU89]
MVVSISVLLLLLIITLIFLRSGSLKTSHAILCAAVGFLIAGTGVAPSVYNGISATAQLVSGIRP